MRVREQRIKHLMLDLLVGADPARIADFVRPAAKASLASGRRPCDRVL